MLIRPLSNELQDKAVSELNEVPSRIQEDVQHIKNWLLQQQHLTNARTDDQWIVTFLRGCKFNLQKTKEKFDLYYTTRSSVPELFANRDPFLPEIQEILNLGLCLPLSETGGLDKPTSILIRCPPDPKKVTFANVLKVVIMIIDIMLDEDDNFIIAGQQGLIDLKGMTFEHVTHLDLRICRKAAVCLHRAYPSRPKAFHCINAPWFYEIPYNMVALFFPHKLRNRVTIYSKKNLNKLEKSIPMNILPEEYGGSEESVEELIEYWKKKVESYHDFFLEEEKYRSEGTKAKQKSSTKMADVESTFSKLEID